MPRLALPSRALGALLVLAAVLMPSCASTGTDLSRDTVMTLTDLGDDVQRAHEQIQAVMGTLTELSRATDLQAKYASYKKETSRLETLADRAANRSQKMVKRAGNYFKAWEGQLDEITSPVVRKLSRERREAALERFERLSANVHAVKEAFDVLIVDLVDIRTYLDFNLNTDGVATAQPLFAQARADAEVVRDLQVQIEVQLRQVADAMDARIAK